MCSIIWVILCSTNVIFFRYQLGKSIKKMMKWHYCLAVKKGSQGHKSCKFGDRNIFFGMLAQYFIFIFSLYQVGNDSYGKDYLKNLEDCNVNCGGVNLLYFVVDVHRLSTCIYLAMLLICMVPLIGCMLQKIKKKIIV